MNRTNSADEIDRSGQFDTNADSAGCYPENRTIVNRLAKANPPMNKIIRDTLITLTALLLAPLAALHAADSVPADKKPESTPRRPNVLLILCDDMGYADLGCQGSKDVQTPNIDRLAKAGVRCTAGYVTAVMCSPSRAGIMTGRSGCRFGYDINWRGQDKTGKCGLPLTEKTAANYLSDKGYVTGVVGKWHLGDAAAFHPLKRGFSEFFGFTGGGHKYFCDEYKKGAKGTGYNTPLEHNGKEIVTRGYLTDVLGEANADFIHRHRDQPWFLYAAFNAPHTPVEAKKADLARFGSVKDKQRRTYCAMVYALDRAVGRMLQQLKDDGLEENTLVFFLSDNGGPGHDINGSSNLPLSGHKGMTMEGGIRVPYIVRWKGTLPENQTYTNNVSSLDILATALTLADPHAPLPPLLEGVDLVPYLQGVKKEAPHPALFWRCENRSVFAVNRESDKVVQQKFPEVDTSGAPRLVNLKTDLQEKTDLSKTDPERYSKLLKDYNDWNSKNIPPRWGDGSKVDQIHGTEQE